jgi:hypothetical protein
MQLKPPHLPKASILVLEQDPFLRADLCSLLTVAGYRLAESADCANHAGRVDLVLAGIGTDQPPEATSELLDRAVPVILIADNAARSGHEFFDAANAFGATAILLRPFSRAALLCLMAKLLSQPPRDAAELDPAEHPARAELLIIPG